MTAYRLPAYRARRFRSPYRHRGGGAGTLAGAAVAVIAAGAGAHAAAHGKPHAQPHVRAAAVTSGSEPAFFSAVLADLRAPVTGAGLTSLAAWASREGAWGTVGKSNPLDTTLPMPGSRAFNTFGTGLHVQSYPTASEGAEATALTIEGGYPLITAAFRSGTGMCGNRALAGELLKWSGGGYEEVC